MVLLGVALEVTAAAFVDDGASRTGLVAGAVVWLAASAVVAGVVGGGVLNGLAPRDGSYRPVLCALVSWAGGLVLTLILGLSLVSAWVLTGGGIVVSEAPARAAMPPGGALSERASPVAEAGSESAGAAAGLAWAIVLLPLLGLGGTIAAACAPRRAAPTRGEDRRRQYRRREYHLGRIAVAGAIGRGTSRGTSIAPHCAPLLDWFASRRGAHHSQDILHPTGVLICELMLCVRWR